MSLFDNIVTSGNTLSRILNETVMHEETICRICFNLLNDIDYHLKARDQFLIRE